MSATKQTAEAARELDALLNNDHKIQYRYFPATARLETGDRRLIWEAKKPDAREEA